MDGLYIGAKAMMSSMNHLESTSNNITNVDTDGYKFDDFISSVYETHDMYKNDGTSREFIGDLENKVWEESAMINFEAGNPQVTNRSLDVYLEDGEGTTSFLVVEDEGEPYLTRAGSLQVNEEGHLKTAQDHFVLDENGEYIQAPPDADVQIEETGEVTLTETGEELGILQQREINEETKELLGKRAGVLFDVEGGVDALPLGEARLHTGMVESSNVNLGKEMSDLMNAQQQLDTGQRISGTFRDIYDKEANEIL